MADMSRFLLVAVALAVLLAGCGNSGGEVGFDGINACKKLIKVRQSAPGTISAGQLRAIGKLGTGSTSYPPDIREAAKQLKAGATMADTDKLAAACEAHGFVVPSPQPSASGS
jgi:hypothetical protein